MRLRQPAGCTGIDGMTPAAAAASPRRPSGLAEAGAANAGTYLLTSLLRCQRCGHLICPETEDWTQACDRKLLPPTVAGD